jgi:hypothetical protein
MGHESLLLLIHQQRDREGLENLTDTQVVAPVENFTGEGVSPRAGKPVRQTNPGILPEIGAERILFLSHQADQEPRDQGHRPELLGVSLMFVSVITALLSRRWSIYEKQVRNKFASPAHTGDLTINVLQTMQVREVYNPGRPMAQLRR